MAKTLLVTFGCSYTFGVGAYYRHGMLSEDFRKNAWNKEVCDRDSWRGILCRRHGLDNVNFASGGSSNQKQFRLAREYFSSQEFLHHRHLFDRIIVLWGTTSTARNEVWCVNNRSYRDVTYTKADEFAKFFVTHCYDHNVEVTALKYEILHWNTFFQALSIDNYWFDSFNTHNYYDDGSVDNSTNYFMDTPKQRYEALAGPDWPSFERYCNRDWTNVPTHVIEEITNMNLCDDSRYQLSVHFAPATRLLPRMLGYQNQPCDLVTWLCKQEKISPNQSQYHFSNWHIDDDRVQHLVDAGLLNPFSHHPTPQGHAMIADFFSQQIDLG